MTLFWGGGQAAEQKGMKGVGHLCYPPNVLSFAPTDSYSAEAKAVWEKWDMGPRDTKLPNYLWETGWNPVYMLQEVYILSSVASPCKVQQERWSITGYQYVFASGKRSLLAAGAQFVLHSWESFEKAKHVCWPFPQRKYSLWKLIILAGIPFFLLRRVKWSYGSVRGHLYNTEEEFPKLECSLFIWRRPGQIGFPKHFLY